MSIDWIITVVMVPAFIVMMKDQIIGVWQDWQLYSTRLYDSDGDPNTPDICQLCHSGTGEKFMCIVEQYIFWPRWRFALGFIPMLDMTRGVWITIISKDLETGDPKYVTWNDWRQMDHRKPAIRLSVEQKELVKRSIA